MSIIANSRLGAEEWVIYGPRAEAMGGSSVASPEGTNAHYWNPAATGKQTTVGLYLSGGLITAAEGDILSAVDKVGQARRKIDWGTVLGKISGESTLDINEAQQLLHFFSLSASQFNKQGQGFMVNPAAGLSLTIGRVTVFGNVFASANLDPVGDDQNLAVNKGPSAITNTVKTGNPLDPLDPAFYIPISPVRNTALATDIAGRDWWISGAGNALAQANNFIWLAEQGGADTSNPEINQMLILMAQNLAGGVATIQDNKTGVIINGLILTEMGVSYSQPLMGEMLRVGANFKMMEGQTYYKKIDYQSVKNSEDMMKDVTSKENIKSSSAFGVDVGGRLVLTDKLQVGLVARNINKPEFSYAGGSKVALDPQIRMGVASEIGIPILGRLSVAMDYDVTKNKSSLLGGYKSQMFGMGAEFSTLMGFLKVRAGTYRNLASDMAAPVYTAGVGIQLIILKVDVAGTFAKEKAKVEADETGGGGKEIPQRVGFSASVSLKF
ncbi:MAG: conjugal transfer protein TraF [Planctomycetota bacterium]|nr:conjugal transfer protein TraF [Planctomycetota bacterium]